MSERPAPGKAPIRPTSADSSAPGAGGLPEALPESEEPVVTGTLFMAIIFLMMVFGFWITMYIMLLDR